MTDPRPFEIRLESALLRLTEGGPVIDAAALARSIAADQRVARPRREWGLGDLGLAPRLALLALTGLLVALVVGTLLVASGVVRPTVTPLVPGRNGLIAYCQGEYPDTRIHLMNADGSGDREVVAGSGSSFSADGTRLTYATGWPHDTKVFVADPDGSNPRLLPDLGTDRGGMERSLS